MAKTLYLMRHAKSDWGNGVSDLERMLNTQGQHDAMELGRRLKNRGAHPEIILCSPARRTRQTAELMLEELKLPSEIIRFETGIYEAAPETLLNLIAELPDDCDCAMLIGHNPAVGLLARTLGGSRIHSMPAGALVTLELKGSFWHSAGRDSVALVDFDYPERS